MGAAKDIWMAEVELIGEKFADGKISRAEAFDSLRRLGFDRQEAAEMLDEATA